MIKYGICDEDYLNVRRNPQYKPSLGHYIRKRSYGQTANYLNFQSSNSEYMTAYKPDTDLSNNDLYRYMPHIYQKNYVERDLSNSALKDVATNDIIQKIISLPAPALDAISQEGAVRDEMERDNKYAAFNVNKPLQYQASNVNFKYNYIDGKTKKNYPSIHQVLKRNEIVPSASHILERNEILPSASHAEGINYYAKNSVNNIFQRNAILPATSHAMDINAYAENDISNEDKYYYQSFRISSPPTREPEIYKLIQGFNTSTAITPPEASTTTTPSPKVEHIFIISRRTMPSKKPNVCKYGNEQLCGVLSNGTLRTFESICEMMTRNSFLKHSKYESLQF